MVVPIKFLYYSFFVCKMPEKKVLIICQSIHHNNTIKVAKAMGEVLNAEIKKPSEIDLAEFDKPGGLDKYKAIGFGSGIYWGRHHIRLMRLVTEFKSLKNKDVFVFSTSGISNALNFPLNVFNKCLHFHSPLKKILIGKGARIVGEFSCRGFDTYGFLKLIGGVSKGRPNTKDLENAKSFARDVRRFVNS